MLFAGSEVNAKNKETKSKAIKTFSLNLDVKTIIAIMLNPTSIDDVIMFIPNQLKK